MKKAAVLGSGKVAQAAATSLSESPYLCLEQAVTAVPDRVGLDLGKLGGGDPCGVELTGSLDPVLESEEIEVVIHCGAESGNELLELLLRLAEHGKTVVTVSGLIHAPTELGAEGFQRLARRTVSGGGRITGAGMNPGFALDLLPAFVSTLLTGARSIRSRRVTDIQHWGDAALRDQAGVGRPAGSGSGGAGFTLLPSGRMLAEALRGSPGDLEESTTELISDRARSDGMRTVDAGEVCGFEKRVMGDVDGLVVELIWTALFCIDEGPDGVEPGISFEAEADLDLTVEFHGAAIDDSYPATGARAVAAAEGLLALAPGLYRPDQVPVSR